MCDDSYLVLLIFDDVEVLEFCGSFEVFFATSRFTDWPARPSKAAQS